MAGKRRTIRESPQYALACDQLRIDARRLDDILRGTTSVIHRDAESGIQPLPGVNVWFKPTYAFPASGIEAFRLWYRIVDDDTVELLHIERIEESGYGSQ